MTNSEHNGTIFAIGAAKKSMKGEVNFLYQLYQVCEEPAPFGIKLGKHLRRKKRIVAKRRRKSAPMAKGIPDISF